MKKAVLAFAIMLAATGAMAQDNNNGNNTQNKRTKVDRTEQMTKKLGLSTEQAEKVKALNTEYSSLFQRGGQRPGGQKGEGMQQGQNSSQERPQMTDEQKEKMQTEMKERQTKQAEYDKKLKAILSDSQYKTYQSMQPQHGQRKQGSKQED